MVIQDKNLAGIGRDWSFFLWFIIKQFWLWAYITQTNKFFSKYANISIVIIMVKEIQGSSVTKILSKLKTIVFT